MMMMMKGKRRNQFVKLNNPHDCGVLRMYRSISPSDMLLVCIISVLRRIFNTELKNCNMRTYCNLTIIIIFID